MKSTGKMKRSTEKETGWDRERGNEKDRERESQCKGK